MALGAKAAASLYLGAPTLRPPWPRGFCFWEPTDSFTSLEIVKNIYFCLSMTLTRCEGAQIFL